VVRAIQHVGAKAVMAAATLLGAALFSVADEPAAPAEANALTPEQQALADEAEAAGEKLGEAYRQGRYAEAVEIAARLATIYRELNGEQSPEYATALNNLAIMLGAAGELEKALPLAEQSLAMTKVLSGEQSADYATGLNNLANIQEELGRYERAAALYREAIEIKKSLLGENHPSYATSLNNLAVVYRLMGHPAQALPLYRQATEIFKTALGETHPSYATTLHNIAVLYMAMGDSERALPQALTALEIQKSAIGEEHPDTASTMDAIAGIYDSMGDADRAEPLYERALEIRRKVLGEGHPIIAFSLNNLASIYTHTSRYDLAEPLYLQSVEICKRVFGNRHPQYAAAIQNLAQFYLKQGDVERAAKLLEEAAKIQAETIGKKSPAYAHAISELALAYDRQGEYGKAWPLHNEAFEYTLESLYFASAVRDEAGQLRLRQSMHEYLARYVLSTSLNPDLTGRAYQGLLNWKGGTLLRQRAARLAVEDKGLQPLLEELRIVIRQWSAMAADLRMGDSRWKARYDELSARKEQLQAEVSERSDEFGLSRELLRVPDIRAVLPEDAALVDYFELWQDVPARDGSKRWNRIPSLVAFVVRKNADVQLIKLGEAAPATDAIDLWRQSFGGSPEGQAAGRLLRERLWEPLVAALGDAKLVLISPDGALGKLPFAALPGEAPGTFLIEDVAISLVPAAGMIPIYASRSAMGPFDRELLAVGGVDYDQRDGGGEGDAEGGNGGDALDAAGIDLLALADARSGVQRSAAGAHWNVLPGTDLEASAINELFQSYSGVAEASVVLGGAAATEEQFRSLAPSSRILHVATHGFFADEDVRSALDPSDDADGAPGAGVGRSGGLSPGLLSGLVLAGANHPPELPDDPADLAGLPEDGILTVEELSTLRLTNVELVVLSACETGLGKIAGGEGLLGIQRAFQIAGARATVASLWRVDDNWTQELMTLFYRNALEKKQSYLEALRNAQLEILRELRSVESPTQVVDADRGANAPDADDAATVGLPYYWAAFSLSGDWR
jgi:CHAT domain-containing protein/tetratricopeptide (TPR) repeat protein